MFIYCPPEGYIADLVTEETVRRKELEDAFVNAPRIAGPCSGLMDFLTTVDVPSATEPGSAKTRGSGSEPQAKGHRVCAIEADDDVPPATDA
jgi:hypothetical protein